MLHARARRKCKSEYKRPLVQTRNSSSSDSSSSLSWRELSSTTTTTASKKKLIIPSLRKNRRTCDKSGPTRNMDKLPYLPPPSPQRVNKVGGINVGLPSPSGSTSETSDYQRSTPSPGQEDSGVGSIDEWSSRVGDESEDHGFSESSSTIDVKDATSAATNANTTAKLTKDEILDQRLMLSSQTQLVELESQRKLIKRRLSDGVDLKLDEATCKKPRLKELSQANIDLYMATSEAKHFNALRKETLDKVLNLKSDTHSEDSKDNLDLITQLKHFKPEPVSRESQTPESAESTDQETKIRFPATQCVGEEVLCKWKDCGMKLESTGKLLDHLKLVHSTTEHKVDDSDDEVVYKCLWEGCKVFGKSSSSKGWLEKHVAGHGGNKPFQCIFEGCKLRFSTQSLLERHVNNHFKPKIGTNPDKSNGQSGSSASNGTICRKSVDMTPPSSAVKVIRKAGKRLKLRRTIFSARIFDLFDLGVMAQVREKLLSIQKVAKKEYGMTDSGDLVLKSEIVARRVDTEGRAMVLQRWNPPNLVEEEWVPESSVQSTKRVNLESLSPCARSEIASRLLAMCPKKGDRSKRKAFSPKHHKDALS